jgi:flagellar M-ring protein FliF
MIRNLVAGAIAGLKRENVTVADLNGRTYTGGGEEGLGSPDEDPYYSRKSMVENQLKQQIDGALGYVPGVLVQVFAELNPEIRHVEESVKLDPKTVAVRTEATTETNNQKGSSPGGRPGLAVQGPGGPAAAVGAASTGRTTSTEVEKTTENTENMVAHDRLEVEKQGLTPEKVKVTVVVPSKYYTQVWNEQNKMAAGEEPKEPDPKDLSEIQEKVKQDIQNAVVALLPEVPAGTDPYPQVTVTTFQSLAGAPLAEVSTTDTAMAWVGQYWSTLGMTGLALFSLMMLRSMVKSVPSTSQAMATSVPSQVAPTLSLVTGDDASDDAQEEINTPRLKRKVRKGPNLKDDLTEMVREDPEAAASILRNWINSAG